MARFNPQRDVLVATVGRPHGVRGLVRLHAATDDPASVEALGALHDEEGREWTARWVAPGIAALLDAQAVPLADRTAAERLVNRRLYAAREALPAPEADEFYHADLVGLAAVSVEGEPFGVVRTVHDYGAGASLETDRGLIVPFTRACVPQVDLAGGRIVVAPPVEIEVEGDLNGGIEAGESELRA